MGHYTVKIQDVYNSILDETDKRLVVVKGIYEKCYIGTLFFEIDAFECLKGDAYEYVILEEPTGKDICITAYELLKKHGMLMRDTLKTMLHWQSIHGVTEDIYIEGYKCETDEELLETLKAKED